MAALTATVPRLVASDRPMETIQKIAKNGATWKAGEFLRVDTSGFLVAIATDVFTNTGGLQYYALADQADPGNATTLATVGIVTQDMEWEGNGISGALTDANVGLEYGLNVASNVTTVDTGESTNLAVTITDVGPSFNPAKYIAADTVPRVRFKINADILEAARAS
jgi:hypothetical protein